MNAVGEKMNYTEARNRVGGLEKKFVVYTHMTKNKLHHCNQDPFKCLSSKF